MKVEHELSNTTVIVISLLEEKFSKILRRDWFKKMNEKDNKKDDENRFTAFLNFPLEQKRNIEYEPGTIRMQKMGLSRQKFHLHNEEEEKTKELDYGGKPHRCLVHISHIQTTSKF